MISKDKPRVKFYSDGSIAWSDFPVISDYEYFGWVWWGIIYVKMNINYGANYDFIFFGFCYRVLVNWYWLLDGVRMP